MTVVDEAMRWTYALSLRPGLFGLDAALAVLLGVFVIVAWRLTVNLVLRRPRTSGIATLHTRPLRAVPRLDGAPSFGNAGTVGRPVQTGAARPGADRQSSADFRSSGSRSSTGT
jgi:hypothetical protein